jgi:hypothetical protein
MKHVDLYVEKTGPTTKRVTVDVLAVISDDEFEVADGQLDQLAERVEDRVAIRFLPDGAKIGYAVYDPEERDFVAFELDDDVPRAD